MDDIFDLYRKLSSLNWFCSDCDAVAYGHYNPCSDCDISKQKKEILSKIDSFKKE